MATSSPASSTARSGRRRARVLRRLAWAIALVLAALAVLYGRTLGDYARTGTAYGAKVGCSCRFVEGRSLGSCRGDLERGTGLVSLSDDEAARSVTARFALGFAQTATYVEGAGCVLEPWRRN